MRFLVDENLPPALARVLGAIGHDAPHIRDLGLDGTEDTEWMEHALARGRVVLTSDIEITRRGHEIRSLLRSKLVLLVLQNHLPLEDKILVLLFRRHDVQKTVDACQNGGAFFVKRRGICRLPLPAK